MGTRVIRCVPLIRASACTTPAPRGACTIIAQIQCVQAAAQMIIVGAARTRNISNT